VTEVLQLQPHLGDWQELGFDVVFVTIAGESTMREFMERREVRMEVFLDRDRSFHKLYGVTAVPRSFIIDKAGIVREIKLGWGGDSLEWLRGWVDRLTRE